MASRSRSDQPCSMSRSSSMDWSSLPADLLLAVLARLPRDADRARFSAVCAGWGAAAASWRPRPWLVGSRTDRFGRGAAMSSFWLSRGGGGGGGGLVPFAAAVPAGFEFLSSSSHGYLALSDPMATPKAVALVNPVTGRRIRLPPIGFFKRWHDVATVVLSADPDTADEWAAVAVGFPTNCLAYYSSAAGAWSPLGFSAAGYAGVEHYRERFYVAFKSQLCVICDVEAAVPAVIPLEQIDGDGSEAEKNDSGMRVVETHLVECDGELLLVSVHDNLERNPEDTTIFDDAGDDDHDGSSTSSSNGGDGRVVEVLRVEWMADGAVRLVRQEDLRSRALFLGRNRAFALSPAEFPACRANCVYLVDQQGHPDGRVSVFDMNADREWEPEEAAVIARNFSRRDETIYPDDVRRDALSAGWARRGWFFPKY